MSRRAVTFGRLKATWERLGTVESDSEPGVEHVISRRGDQVGCDCLSYRFKKGEKTCKHIEAFRESASVAVPRGAREAVYIGSRAAETFTVRRAIEF